MQKIGASGVSLKRTIKMQLGSAKQIIVTQQILLPKTKTKTKMKMKMKMIMKMKMKTVMTSMSCMTTTVTFDLNTTFNAEYAQFTDVYFMQHLHSIRKKAYAYC